MRTVLVTGPGGAGRTTVAAATALAAARGGLRVLVLSTDPVDTLGAALGITTGSAPAEAAPGLCAARVDSGAHFRAELLALQERAGSVLDLLGANRLATEELTELPGSEQFALLRALRTCGEGAEGGSAAYDLVVVDLPPLHAALAALALPEQLRRYLRRLLPPERQAARALRPMLAQLAGVPMPAQWLYETAARWDGELAAVEALLADPGTTVRLVAEPGPAGADALRTARTGLALFGLRVESVTANRTLPQGSPDTWLATLAAQQQKCLAEWADWYGARQPAAPVREVRHLGGDPRGLDGLDALAADGALAVEPGRVDADEPWTVEDRLAEDGVLVWHLPLPGAVKEELGLVRRGDELVLDAGPFRRILTLPSALRRCDVSGAGLTGGVLKVRFTPDQRLWPQTK
ncbi:ArsA family ATPase [Streptomyces sp. ISL-100]|uniref:ArsA family ATPase n=1 Tax=Streptomyces sp. ISL-100 TaxID=2819173 RepID=UPI001BE684A5|nr:ArsA-related P-loop ATPase [Streptomyces sp. ISL-100]MBT2399971.1 ArsA family ATPase [Streptomyces sp. ISL-100]